MYTLLFIIPADALLVASKAHLIVNMGEYAVNARSAEGLLFVSMGDNA